MKKYLRNIAVGGLVLLTGCNNFLDVVPDDRTEINTTEKLAKLVADAYPKASYAAMLNSRVDFVTDKGSGKQENNSNTDPFFWRDVEDETQDTPTWFWRKFYYSIAEVNHALRAAEEMGAPKEQEPYIAEAKMIRSFSHFMLVSLFAKFYDKDSDNSSPGVPYVTEPETVALAKYDRETVAKTYEKIEKDLIESIDKLGSDAIYTVPRYHFTRAAANAYASRFYLYKGDWGKVITYASKVFPMPSVFVGQEGAKNVSDRDNANIYAKNNFQPWLTTYAVAPGSSDVKIAYTKSDNTSNLLLTEMSSRMSRYANTWRYGCVKSDLEQTLTSSALNVTGGQWAYRNWYNGDNYYVPKYYELFIKTDINASSGTIYTIFPTFRNEEVLLNRAEAYVMLEDYEKALADLNIFCRQRIKNYNEEKHVITEQTVVKFYNAALSNEDHFMKKYNAYGSASWSDVKKALILCILDFRRNEFMWEGLRWWDMMRYRIPITHTTKEGDSNTLYPGDDRWLLQLPETAELADVQLNPRSNFLSRQW